MIRDIVEDDIPQLLLLWGDYQKFFGIDDINDFKNEKFIRRILEDRAGGRIIGAFDGGDLIGYSSYFLSYASTACARLANINDLFVVPRYRRRGIGTRLLTSAISGASDSGAELIRWLASPDNIPALGLYRRFGSATNWQLFAIDTRESPSWKL